MKDIKVVTPGELYQKRVTAEERMIMRLTPVVLAMVEIFNYQMGELFDFENVDQELEFVYPYDSMVLYDDSETVFNDEFQNKVIRLNPTEILNVIALFETEIKKAGWEVSQGPGRKGTYLCIVKPVTPLRTDKGLISPLSKKRN
jgi:hypothetical protein